MQYSEENQRNKIQVIVFYSYSRIFNSIAVNYCKNKILGKIYIILMYIYNQDFTNFTFDT